MFSVEDASSQTQQDKFYATILAPIKSLPHVQAIKSRTSHVLHKDHVF